MNKIVILGSGAAPGVPSLSSGWGKCDALNRKNNRLRSGTYIEYKGVKFLIDTSPDIRQQLIKHQIRSVDAVLYSHAHGDHLHGIDYLREFNRINRKGVNIYADAKTMKAIKKGFGYLLVDKENVLRHEKPSLVPHKIKCNHSFYIKKVKITPLKLLGHQEGSVGYAFDDGEIVFISDFKELSMSAVKMISKQPKVMIMPLTTLNEHAYHASLEQLKIYNEKFKPKALIINHMSTDCDYNVIKGLTPKNMHPAYDNMIIEGF